MWNRATLREFIHERLDGYKLIVVSNREPYLHTFEQSQIVCRHPASGMATALDPVLKASGGTWIAHGSGNADRRVVDACDRVAVPPQEPQYTLRRVWLSKDEEQGFYYGLSNEGLWPLCHVTFTRPRFVLADWKAYQAVNQRFSDAVLEEAGSDPCLVFIQDYHFALLPRLLKQQAGRSLLVAQFWHIPWPNVETFRVFPWKEELLEGLLGNDLLGFHIRYHCQNFLETVDRFLEARIDYERNDVIRGGEQTRVAAFPISIDVENHEALAVSSAVEQAEEDWRRELRLTPDTILGAGIERLDYTKGIVERLQGIDAFLQARPENRGRVQFVQVAVPSRSRLPEYRALEDEVDRVAEEINWRWSTDTWQPLTLLKQHHDRPRMIALHRLAKFFIVSSLHDGMNLVAKEYVASRTDEQGVLILSRFTGASRELTDALPINPFAIHEISDAILQAIEMPLDEQTRRMQRMRAEIEQNNVYRWAGKILSCLLKLEPTEAVG